MQLFEKYATVLWRLTERAIKKENIERAMAAISAYSFLAYEWNQFYCDDRFEEAVCKLSQMFYAKYCSVVSKPAFLVDKKSVLFYDGFGLDTRGLACIYLNALVRSGYNVIYTTKLEAEGKQPEIKKVLASGDSKAEYIDITQSYCRHISELTAVFEKYKPAKAFFYTQPDDVAAAVAFQHYEGLVTRFQINLTDHAFWLGKSALDVCIEFREYGAGISLYGRGIARDRIHILPMYPWVDKNMPFQGFDFSTEGKKILFSGGSLYKTIGGDNKFYFIVDKVLAANENIIFIYAGGGDDSELKKLMLKWKGRVYHIAERKDLFALMQHIDVYLSTYPITGGLMTQCAAMAGKLPLCLVDINPEDARGMLINQEELGIEFYSVDDIVEEINCLFRDDAYRKRRYQQLKDSVIDEEQFRVELENILEGKGKIEQSLSYPDTKDFMKEYEKRFCLEMVSQGIMRKRNKTIIHYFPLLLIRKIYTKYLKRVHR